MALDVALGDTRKDGNNNVLVGARESSELALNLIWNIIGRQIWGMKSSRFFIAFFE